MENIAPQGLSFDSPVSTSRKRKSEEFDTSLTAIDTNASSGLQRPGWGYSKSSHKSRKRTISREEELLEAPKETMDAIISKHFGDREEAKSRILKRRKPTQKLYGYAKEFLDMETKRLASSLKETIATRDKFIDHCRDHERALLSTLDASKCRVKQLVISDRDSRSKLQEAEKKCAQMQQSKNGLQNQVTKLKSSLTTEKEKANALSDQMAQLQSDKAAAESKLTSIQDEINQQQKQLDLATEVASTSKTRLAEIEEQLQEAESAKIIALGNQETAHKVEVSKLKEKLLRLETDKSNNEAALKELREERNELFVKVTAMENDLFRIKQTNEQLHTQLNQKDQHLDKTLETFQQNQSFSQERIASLNQEKQSLETRSNELQTAKANLEIEGTKLSQTVKELTESNTNLTESLETTQTILSEVQKQNSDLSQKLETVSRQAAGMTVQVEKLTSQLETEVKSKAEMETSLTEKITELSSQNAALESEVEALRTTYSNTGGANQDQLERLCEVSKEAELLKRQVTDFDGLQEELARVKQTLKETEMKLFESDKAKRNLHNEVQSLKGKVRVVARVRPMFSNQATRKEDCDGDIEMAKEHISPGIDGSSLTLETTQEQSSGLQVKHHQFNFDRVFAPRSNQQEVFDEVSSFVQSALDGYNVCLFSYGQTGSGKTHTMMGDHIDQMNRGIIPRAIDQIMSYQTELRAKGWEYTLEATYVEIYNETIRDLLVAKPTAKPEIRDSKREINVTNLRRHPIQTKDQIHQVLGLAQRNRSVAATDVNLHSSRSHSVFSLFIKGIQREYGAQVTGSLSMCDLAGSERIAKSGASGDRLKEAQNINKSLSTLATVFSALQKKNSHVPYRNSKLTHMLQACFAGEGKTMMIVNLSPEQQDLNESLCSLRFAGQVANTELGKAKKMISAIHK